MKSAPTSHSILSEEACHAKLHAIGQDHLIKEWMALTPQQRKQLRRQITTLDADLFKRQQAYLFKAFEREDHPSLQPFHTTYQAGVEVDVLAGQQLVSQGKVALVILAGGQGSRLGHKGPKGCVEVSSIKKKSLFQLVAEKIKAASHLVKRPLEVAIMTSPLNHLETQVFFAQHAFFGLQPSQVTFFYQRMWPFLDLEGNLFLEAPDQIARGPNGNGSVFHRLVELGIWEKWRQAGVQIVNMIPIDNPLADPFDFGLFSFQQRQGADVVIKAALRKDPHERVGVLVEMGGKPAVVEYSELSKAEKTAQEQDGKLKFPLANLGLLSFSLEFIRRVSSATLPLHVAKKAVKALTQQGESLQAKEPNAWKFEEFIFDVLPFAYSPHVLLVSRELAFAPLKNLRGEDSIATVQAALLAFDRHFFHHIAGTEPPQDVRFELAPQFYYPTPELLEKWRGKPFPNKDYIDD